MTLYDFFFRASFALAFLQTHWIRAQCFRFTHPLYLIVTEA